MTMFLEIISVLAAFAVLVMAGVTLVRNAVGLGRSAKVMLGHVQPKVSSMMTQTDVAQQRVFSITNNLSVLPIKIESLRVSAGRLFVIISALREASQRISKLMRRLGF